MPDEIIETPDDTTILPPAGVDGAVPKDDGKLPLSKPGDKPSEPAPAEELVPETSAAAAEDTAFDIDVWGGSTGDESGDSVLELLHESGVDVDVAKSLLYDAVKAGDPSKIDRDALVEKVGKATANLIIGGITTMTTNNANAIKAATDAVHAAAGGEKAWDVMLPWITKNVAEGDLNEYRSMINEGGIQATLAVTALREKYNADPETTRLGKEEVLGDTPATVAKEGISKLEYGRRLQKLHRSGTATPAARAELLALRRAGTAQSK